jgi:hypothetical protein
MNNVENKNAENVKIANTLKQKSQFKLNNVICFYLE